MTDEQFKIDPKHAKVRNVLRIVGPVVLGIGVLFFVAGAVSFFAAFGGSGPPALLWAPFVGMPTMAAGGVMCRYGYVGKVARYMAEEIAPVGKDTFNYLADGTRQGVKAMTRAVAEGLAEGGIGLGGAAAPQVRCHKCNALIDSDARFCDQCGTALAKTKPCPQCDELNDPDARFCDNCGYPYPHR